MKNHHSFKVFIVEDDVWYGSMLQHYLSLNPEYEVKRFESPRDFFGQLHENPDVVTLDYSLPDCDGAEVLKKIKEHNPDIRVIVISGQEDVATAINLLKNRLHLDLRTADLEAETARVTGLGATRLTAEPIIEHGWRWHVLADPDGNEFCVLQPPAPPGAGPAADS